MYFVCVPMCACVHYCVWVYMCVCVCPMAPEDTYYGTVYTSDDRGVLYSKSLERHLFGGEGKSDFTNITSLRGVYLTNVLEEGRRPDSPP